MQTALRTQGPRESSQTWSIDPTGSRFATSTITTGSGASASTTTKTFGYDNDSDSPAIIDEGDGTGTRLVEGFDGEMVAMVTVFRAASASVTWQLSNMHADVAASLPNTTGATVVAAPADEEHGAPLDAPVTGSTTGTSARYAWLGALRRSTATATGDVLMGMRQYRPTAGSFLSTDSLPGGNPTLYTYPVDPVNYGDVDGRWPWWLDAIWSPQYAYCEKLAQEIKRARDMLAKRKIDFEWNVLGFRYGDRDYNGHVQQWLGWQRRLRGLLNDFNTHGCCQWFGLPYDAWHLATMGIPALNARRGRAF